MGRIPNMLSTTVSSNSLEFEVWFAEMARDTATFRASLAATEHFVRVWVKTSNDCECKFLEGFVHDKTTSKAPPLDNRADQDMTIN